jgi:hypothetical protein
MGQCNGSSGCGGENGEVIVMVGVVVVDEKVLRRMLCWWR